MSEKDGIDGSRMMERAMKRIVMVNEPGDVLCHVMKVKEHRFILGLQSMCIQCQSNWLEWYV